MRFGSPRRGFPLATPRSPRGRGAAALHPITNESEDNMTTDATKRIAELNDLCRTAMGIAGRLVQTAGICALPQEDQSAIREKVEMFDAFTPDNDPYGERDFGAFEHNGQRIFWKIDYYDTTLTYGSEDPSDPKQTVRVLTIMFASEY
jgi:Protein of unknown function (DUF3768)